MDEGIAAALRAPFAPSEVGKLPKLSCSMCSKDPKKVCEKHKKIQCDQCGGYHSNATIHLDFVGHAEVTDRLLAVDPGWSWEPLSIGPDGLPLLDRNGGLWIKLTVAGTTRLGYGDAPGKTAGNAVKEAIGDGIRNAAMRFGVALDLWRKTERSEANAERSAPDPADPDGQIIGHGSYRVTVDEWHDRVTQAEALPLEAADEALRAMWDEAGPDARMQQPVRDAVARWKLRSAKEQAELAAHDEAKATALASQPALVVNTKAQDDQVDELFRNVFMVDLDQAQQSKDATTVRRLIKHAHDAGYPDLKRTAQAVLDAFRKGQ